jgi:hypothetical protein
MAAVEGSVRQGNTRASEQLTCPFDDEDDDAYTGRTRTRADANVGQTCH